MKGGTQRRSNKLSKGQKTQLKQQKISISAKIGKQIQKLKKTYAPKNLRLDWIKSIYGSNKYRPHQGHQECARRVKQLSSGFIK